MGADDDVGAAFFDPLQGIAFPFAASETREHLDLYGGIGKSVAEVVVVLLGQQRRGHEYHHLAAGTDGQERGAHGDFGLAETDIAADDAIHRPRCGHVGDHRLDGSVLVRGLLEREARREAQVFLAGHVAGESFPGLAPGVDVEQLGSGVADFLGRLALGLVPGVRAQLVQGSEFVGGAGVARDELEVVDRYVELGAAGIFQR